MFGSERERRERVFDRVKTVLANRCNSVFGGFQDVLWLIGSGRSGTTWLSRLLNTDDYFVELFEPFHPTEVERVSGFTFHHYLSPSCQGERIEAFYKDVFRGDWITERVNASPVKKLRYRGLLVKDIFANLMAFRIWQTNPAVKPVLIVRHPLAVALSKHRRDDWDWCREPDRLFAQTRLRADFLVPVEHIAQQVRDSQDQILKYVLVWCIVNWVPLKQFSADTLHVVFYEDVVTRPRDELEKIWTFLGRKPIISEKRLKQVLDRPTWTARPKGIPALDEWKTLVSDEQLAATNRILECFQLDQLYDEDGVPDREKLPWGE